MESSERLEIKARAKINLCLNVTGKCGEKHALDTVMTPVNLYDTVFIRKSDGFSVTYAGQPSPYSSDVVKKTIEALKCYFNGGVEIDIIKRIPEKAGVGGSSADAVATVRGLEKLYGFKADSDLLERIGSDLPSMYFDRPCRMRGTGKEVEPIYMPENIKFVLVTGVEGVSTKECFDTFDTVGGTADVDGIVESLKRGEYFIPQNALGKSARILSPDIALVISAMERAGFSAEITGSGSGVFSYEYSEEKYREKITKLRSILDEKYKIITL